MIMRKLSPFCVAAGLFLLSACSSGNPASSTPVATASSNSSPISAVIDHAMDKASAKLATGNVTVSSNDDNTPKAEITPRGDFLIADKPVPLTSLQRNEMLAYRAQLIEIAKQGIAIGKQGAKLGVSAASEAIAGALSGESDQQIRQRVEAQASGIRQAAANICGQLPAMMESQQKLAADVPAFKPYADMTQKDIQDCRKDALKDDDND
ncbi:MAG: hypothetical protein KGJ94_09995 [Xanthomonadaceae bacterium]|nr:hypothetical protein [Xanthomonadaceae bacterium]